MGATRQGGPTLAAGAVLVDRAGRVLLVLRGRPPAAGSWSLPGGHVEPGESPEQAIVREVREETAISARVVCPLGVVEIAHDDTAYAIHEFLLEPVDPGACPSAGDDAHAVRWVGLDELEPMGVSREARRVLAIGLAQARARGLLT